MMQHIYKSQSQPQPRLVQHTDIVFLKLVPSGKLENRILEAAYVIYNPKTRDRISRSFIFFHPPSHDVYADTFSDYHTAPTEADGRSLLQLCKDKSVAKQTIQDFCTSFSGDLNRVFPSSTRHVTFVGDHIWQTRSLLFRFMFGQSPWIKLPKRMLIHFVEFRTFMQPFAVMHAQMDVPFELPQWIFRAATDVNGQANFFDNMVQLALPRVQFSEFKNITCPDERFGECKMINGTSCDNPKCQTNDTECQTNDMGCQTDSVLIVPECGDMNQPETEAGELPNDSEFTHRNCSCHACQ